MDLSWPMGGAIWSAVTYGRYCEQKRLSSSHSPERHLDVAKALTDHRPPGSMPPTQTKGKDRAGAGQDSEPTPYAHHLSTVLINLCVRHSYFIMWRARVQVRGANVGDQEEEGQGKVACHGSGGRPTRQDPLVRGLGHGQVARRHRAHVHRQLWHHARWCKR